MKKKNCDHQLEFLKDPKVVARLFCIKCGKEYVVDEPQHLKVKHLGEEKKEIRYTETNPIHIRDWSMKIPHSPQVEEWSKQEPWISIEGVLRDLMVFTHTGMTHKKGLEEIKGYVDDLLIDEFANGYNQGASEQLDLMAEDKLEHPMQKVSNPMQVEEWEKGLEKISYDIDDEDFNPRNEPAISFSDAKDFIHSLLLKDREKQREVVLNEIRRVADIYSGAGESDCVKYNIIRGLEETVEDLLTK